MSDKQMNNLAGWKMTSLELPVFQEKRMGGDGMSVYLLFCVLWVSKGGVSQSTELFWVVIGFRIISISVWDKKTPVSGFPSLPVSLHYSSPLGINKNL